MTIPSWTRIDHKRRLINRPKVLRNSNGDSSGILAARVYGLGGNLWPRISIAIHRRSVSSLQIGESWLDPGGIIICSSIKRKKGAWWNSCEIPVELMGEIPELIEEASGNMNEWLDMFNEVQAQRDRDYGFVDHSDSE